MKILWARVRPRTLAVISVFALVCGLASVQSAQGVGSGTSWPVVPTAVPAAFTPNITDGTVFAITQVGDQIIVGGTFTGVQNHGSTTTVPRTYVLAFNAATGVLSTTFAPVLSGTVRALLPGPVADTVYVGGDFATANGVKSKGITLLNTTTGAIVTGFKPPALNGIVYSLGMAGSRLYLAGSFTSANLIAHGGLLTLNPTTGAIDPFRNLATAGHHNYNGSGANGAVGPRAMAVNPSGTRAIVLGDFKTVGGLARDQAVMLDLDGATATVDTGWATAQFTAACSKSVFDSYVTDVQYSADGSYFAITATGGASTNNTDGTPSLCDSASRWESSTTGTNVKPTWVDYTGRDTLWSVAVTGTAVYVGGHERWLNNSNGLDNAGPGAIPRPGLAALDPISGVPLTWNPGRNPRGSGAYALFVGPSGLYVGSDTDFIGNNKYKHQKIAFFPLAGGQAPASTTTAQLPSNMYEAGPLPSSNDLDVRTMDGTTIGALATVPNTGVSWGASRGAFAVGDTIFYGSGSNFYRASFNGTAVGTPVLVDPYNDPIWATVQTGSGQTYKGNKPTYYTEMANITGAFYSNGKLYYAQSGSTKPALYWRWFSPDSGTIGSQEFSVSTSGFSFGSTVAGMTLSGSTLYYANKIDGSLHAMPFANGVGTFSQDVKVSGAPNDWRARSLFLYGTPLAPNQLPTATATSTCNGLNCAFDGSTSADLDGNVVSYAWTFGDNTTGTGVSPTHTYAQAGQYPVTLTVTDDRGGVSPAWSGTVTVQQTGAAVAFVGESDFNGSTASPSVVVPAGVNAGDTEFLFVTANTNGLTTSPPTGLTGWTQIAQRTNAPMETTVFQRVATAGDSGQTVTVPLTATARVDLQLVDYSGVVGGTPVVATAGDSNTASHATLPVTVALPGSWVLSYWSDRTSATATWSLPAAVTSRGLGYGTGGGRIDSAIADSGQPVPSGSYAGQTANGGQVAGKGDMVTVVLEPGTT